MSDKDPQTSDGDGDPSGSGNQSPTDPSAGGPKAGTVGTGPKMVPEADLLVQKQKAEGLEAQLAEAQTAHNTALTKVGEEHESTRQKLLATEAKVTTLEERSRDGAGSSEELVQARKLYDEAINKGVVLEGKLLDALRQSMVAAFGITPDSVKDKTLEQLGQFEEALKAVTAGKGTGPYALGGGAGATPQTATDRARAILAEADKKRAGGSPSSE